MKNVLVSLYYLFPAIITIILVLLTPISSAQLTTSENRILLHVQKLLEYPQVLQGWNNFTNFCSLPPLPSLNIVCSNGHTLSKRFSIESFFTVLTKLSNLKVLSLVSLGLWGPLPSNINRFWFLEVLNVSSNFMYGEITPSISSLKNLRSLVLADNLFNGSAPDLGRLDSLEELNLGGNKLGPEFPLLSKNLVRVILSNNSLRCRIPPQLMHVYKLQLLDISSNAIFGNVPSYIFSLPFLKYLNLAANQLSGSLSVNVSCSSALTFVDISHNLLVGTLPSCIGSKALNRTTRCSGNCLSTRSLNDQYPSSYCQKVEALAVKPSPKWQKRKSEMQLDVKLGIAGLLLVLFIPCIFRKFKAEKADVNYRIDTSAADVRAYQRSNINARSVPPATRQPFLGFPPYYIFPLEEIENATNNFDPSNLIADGSEGQLYNGWLINGSMVLVNRVKLKQKCLHKNSIECLKVLPYLRHGHLVSILGHCVTTQQDHPQMISTIFIVFEHVSNVSLRDYLADGTKREMLKWPQRMAISIGIASGIQFLHTRVRPGIFGNNIKIVNILLDDTLNAKVSGYSIPWPSKKSLHRRKLCDQMGSTSTNKAEKEDIYQFGVILLEVITGKLITSSRKVEELKDELQKGLLEAASPSLRGESPILRGVADFFIRETCDPSDRPSIEDILWNLQYSLQVQEPRISGVNLFTKV
ncbi:hypothetical protein PHAVU_002G089300 [Phaseolus vulgaris]|uniref:Protein kinase domain-containing protein n=1 Tax=Phaseolus vulgaris TaxID=3885 RepID=V7CLD0_PHAVU|nr:hypothetical protein PHAVU_002G089300g [Phaseolus vulgaris]ESW29671.1 hypothetical protein PHAVU_002G089300g [Phaseolus vulgaris]